MFVFIPIIPEIIERIQVKYQITEGRDEFLDAMINDKCNDAYGLIYAFSMFVSPLVGSGINNLYGPRKTCDYFMLANLVVAIVLLVFNCGPNVFTENREFRKQLEDLQAKLQEDAITYGYDSLLTYDTNVLPGKQKRTRSDHKLMVMGRKGIRFEMKTSMA